MKKILITGSNGLLGQKLVYMLRERRDVQCIATARGGNRLVKKDGYTYASLDISNATAVRAVFSPFLPDAVINSAALTHGDACEAGRENCWLLLVTAVQHQVAALEALKQEHPGSDPHFIPLSTDLISAGTHAPLDESAEP